MSEGQRAEYGSWSAWLVTGPGWIVLAEGSCSAPGYRCSGSSKDSLPGWCRGETWPLVQVLDNHEDHHSCRTSCGASWGSVVAPHRVSCPSAGAYLPWSHRAAPKNTAQHHFAQPVSQSWFPEKPSLRKRPWGPRGINLSWKERLGLCLPWVSVVRWLVSAPGQKKNTKVHPRRRWQSYLGHQIISTNFQISCPAFAKNNQAKEKTTWPQTK